MNESEEADRIPLVMGWLSFIPGIGVLFGIISIAWGLFTKRNGGRKLALLGICGISISVAMYGSSYYIAFVQKGGPFDEFKAKQNRSNITKLVQSIEFYNIQHGNYPKTLEILKQAQSASVSLNIYDDETSKNRKERQLFYYERKGDKNYYLLGVGADKKPFTQDDLVPDIIVDANGTTGLMIHEASIVQL